MSLSRPKLGIVAGYDPIAEPGSAGRGSAPEWERGSIDHIALIPELEPTAVVVPPSVPPGPVEIATWIDTPLCDTGLSLPSRSWIAGCGLSSTPAWPVVG